MKHVLHEVSAEEAFQELIKREAKGLVERRELDDMVLFHYTQECQNKGAWDKFTLAARGLIIDTRTMSYLAVPFPKFFNLYERALPVPDGNFRVDEKMDGSLGMLFWHEEYEWMVATKKSFNSEQAIWAFEYLAERIGIDCLDEIFERNVTYLFEIICPHSRIVVPYTFDRLTLLAAFNRDTLEEVDDDHITSIWRAEPAVYLPGMQQFDNVEAVYTYAKELPWHDEGFVLRFDDGYRLKIKGPEYVRRHRILSGITPIGIWDLLRNKEYDSVLLDVPEEALADYKALGHILRQQYHDYEKEAITYCQECILAMPPTLTRIGDKAAYQKAFALEVQKRVPGPMQALMYLIEGQYHDRIEEFIWKRLRPYKNQLEGWVPQNGFIANNNS